MKNSRSIALNYFRPKEIEYYGNRTIYDLIGIKFFKKYLPTTGDIVSRKKEIKHINLKNTNRYEELYRYEKKTRNYEWRHIIGTILFIAFRFLFDSELRMTILDYTILPILNLFINIYPIFLQRYNRIRILKILNNSNMPSPYDS